MAVERVKLKIGNMAKAVLVTGQAYQDPKDALNEFISNAADEYAEADRRGERIRVVLRRKGRYPVIAIDDVGAGMDLDKLRSIAKNLFESDKVGDVRTLGEKAIGILAFQQLGARCDIVTRPAGSSTTHALRLQRGKATAELDANERRRARERPGTTVYISEIDPEVARVLTQRKVVDYLRHRRGPALARGDYVIEVQEGRSVEVVTPDKPDCHSRRSRRSGVASSSLCTSHHPTVNNGASLLSGAPARRSSTTWQTSTSSRTGLGLPIKSPARSPSRRCSNRLDDEQSCATARRSPHSFSQSSQWSQQLRPRSSR